MTAAGETTEIVGASAIVSFDLPPSVDAPSCAEEVRICRRDSATGETSAPLSVVVRPLNAYASLPAVADLDGDDVVIRPLPGFTGSFEIELRDPHDGEFGRIVVPVRIRGK